MAIQFAPTPQFKTQSLVPQIKLTPVQRQSVPLRSLPYRDREKERDERRDMMLALILGAGGSQAISSGIMSLLGKVPGLEDYLQEDVPEVTAPTVKNFEERAAALGLDPVQTKAYVDSMKLGEAVYPSGRPAGKRDTGLGQLLRRGLEIAPAAAMKTPTGVKTFGTLFADRFNREADLAKDVATAERALTKDKAALVRERTKAYLGDQKRIRFYGLDPNTGKEVSRNGIDVEGDRFVVSQGTEYDIGMDGNIVPAGQLYRNPILTANTNDAARGAFVFNNYMSQDGKGRLKLGYSRIVQMPDGGTRGATFIVGEGPNGQDLEVGPGNRWVIAKGDALNELKETLGEVDEEQFDFWNKRYDQINSAITTLNLVGNVVDILDKNPGALTVTGGAIPSVLADLEANISAAKELFKYDSVASVFNSRNKDGQQIYKEAEKARALRLKSAVDAFQNDPSDPAKRDQFLKLFEEFRGNVNDQYGNEVNLNNIFGSGTQQAQSARARVLATQLQLAYRAAATAGQTGRTLSDKDLANFLQIVGYGGAQNAQTIKEQLYSFTNQVVTEFDSDAQIFNWQNDPQSLSRYLGVNLKVDPDVYSRALTADGAAEREEVLNQLQRKIGPAGTMFFTFVENPDDGTFSLRIHDFEGVAGKSQTISDILDRARSVSGGKPTPGTGQQKSGAATIQLI
tara:strand:+ start:236 stop:2284 length:2049 start_codon:yes stop_codon:yes gene_type:complete